MENVEATKLAEYCELLSNIANHPDNKKCFDCADTTSPRFLCTNFSTFICSCCATIHQELGHKIKVLSIFSFDMNEVYVLQGTGNKVAADKWLARWTPEVCGEPDPTSPTYKEDARKYMRLKYIEKKWIKLPPPLPLGEKRKASQGEPSISRETSPASSTDNSPRWYSDSSAEPSPRDAEQHDSDRKTNPFLSDPPQTPPTAVIFVPQNMISNFTFPPGQYGYPQYPIAVDISQLPQYYAQVSPHGQTSFNPFENAPPVLLDTGRSPERITNPQYHSYKDMPRIPTEDVQPHPPVLRSASDNSLIAYARLQFAEDGKSASGSQINIKDQSPRKGEQESPRKVEESPRKGEPESPRKADQPLIDKENDNVKTENGKESIFGKAEVHKQKLQGIVNKVTGLLKKNQS